MLAITNTKCTSCGCNNATLTHKIFKFLCAKCYMIKERINLTHQSN